MSKDEVIEAIGVIIEAQRGSIFIVEIENKKRIICHISGKLRKNKIKLVTGDKVKVELSVYDLAKGRISYRL